MLEIQIVKTMAMNICIGLTILKILNIKNLSKKEFTLTIGLNIIIILLYYAIYRINPNYKNTSITNLLEYLIYSFCFVYIIKIPISSSKKTIVIAAISIAFISKFVSGIIVFMFVKLNIIQKEIMEYNVLGIIQLVLIYTFFKIKRFKNGISFLKQYDNVKEKYKTNLILSFTILLSCTLIALLKNRNAKTNLMILLIILTFLIVIWIRKSITNYYKKRLKDRTVERQAEQLKEKDEKIAELQTELAGVLKINHKYNQRLSAMEDAVKKLGERINFSEEFANEYADVMNSVNEFSKEYKQELAKINKDELTKTNIYSIDSLLEFLKKEANDANIKFKLNVNGNINEMLEKFIQKNKLETLIADHVRDAIIAIKSSDNEKREILLNLGKYGDYYEVCIQDTGIEFEIDTLLKLGKEQVTTHKDEGGSGIGFVTTFETMRECEASLVIKENHPESKYTKSVIIRFDGKNEYRISSYRAIMIKDKNQDGRIIID